MDAAAAAGDLNKMYGTMTDKAIRMAETIEFTQVEVKSADAARDAEYQSLSESIIED